jgi:hypothetical protein
LVKIPPFSADLVFLKKSMNGVVWYILGVVFVLVFFPLDIAVVSILM